jgi:hypothetical protein
MSETVIAILAEALRDLRNQCKCGNNGGGDCPACVNATSLENEVLDAVNVFGPYLDKDR